MQLFCKGPHEGFGYGLVWDHVPSNLEICFLLIFFFLCFQTVLMC
jgi:hypothetical protein